MIAKDKMLGAMFGAALGDVLGSQTRVMSLDQIGDMFGTTGRMYFPRPAQVSDHTRLMLTVSQALVTARSSATSELVRSLVAEYVRWLENEATEESIQSCVNSVDNLRDRRARKKSWTEAPVIASSNIAITRSVATAFVPDLVKAIDASKLQAAMTHADSSTVVVAELMTLAIRYSAVGMNPVAVIGLLMRHADEPISCRIPFQPWLERLSSRWELTSEDEMKAAWSQMRRVLRNVAVLLDQPRKTHDVCASLGSGRTAEQAFAVGLFHAVKLANDPVAAVSQAARTSGHSDAIASITGAILGAFSGDGWWPVDWKRKVERSQDIRAAVSKLAALWPVTDS